MSRLPGGPSRWIWAVGREAAAADSSWPVDSTRNEQRSAHGGAPGAARRTAGLLCGRRDGHQGAGVDGPVVPRAGVLLPRDRAQPAGRASGSSGSAWCSSTTSPTCPPGMPDHAVGARVTTRGRRGRSGARVLRRRFGVPARHQGPPRGQGPRRQGVPDHLRRPRGPRGSGRHDGGRSRLDRSCRSRSTRSTRSPTSTGRSPCSPRPRCRTATGRVSPSPSSSDSPTCGRRGAATSASPPRTGRRR